MPAVLAAALALAGFQGLPVLHSPQAEQAQQEALLARLHVRDQPDAAPVRRAYDPNDPAEKRAAAWRADHLTCTSRKGRTADQYQRECGVWLAEEAARAAR